MVGERVILEYQWSFEETLWLVREEYVLLE